MLNRGRPVAGLLLLLSVTSCWGCIFKYGSSPEGLEHVAHLGSPWGYGMGGLDWEGDDGAGNQWLCKAGRRQSPIHVHPGRNYPIMPDAGRTIFDAGVITSNGTNVQVINNGHTVQLEWTDPSWHPNITVALPGRALLGPLTRAADEAASANGAYTRVKVTPVQFHFHTHSEHLLQGAMYPVELHIVCRVLPDQLPGCGGKGCFTVIGVLIAMDPDDTTDNPALKPFWDIMPLQERTVSYLPAGQALNLSALLPADLSYFTYAGSLTTPPCTEGILWHLLVQPIRMSYAQYEAFMLATGDNNCSVAYQEPHASAHTEALTSDARRRHLLGTHRQAERLLRHDHAHASPEHNHHHQGHQHHNLHDHHGQHHHHRRHMLSEHHLEHSQDITASSRSEGGGEQLLQAAASRTSRRHVLESDLDLSYADSGSNSGLSKAKYTCTKQGVGSNYRVIQNVYDRPIYQWVQQPAGASSTTAYIMWGAARQDAPAAEAGAIVGAVLGSIFGAALVTVVALFAYRRYRKRASATAAAAAANGVGALEDMRPSSSGDTPGGALVMVDGRSSIEERQHMLAAPLARLSPGVGGLSSAKV